MNNNNTNTSKITVYKFSTEINNKLEGFKTYLKNQGNGEDTIRQKSNYAGYFLRWTEKENIPENQVSYNDLLGFIEYCKRPAPSEAEGDSKRLINSKLRSIRNYYEYLKTGDETIVNPAVNLYLKGIRHKLPSNIISYKAIEKLYENYSTGTLRDKRNKVILGLMVYQGVTTGELHRLEPSHINLKKGKIYIPGSSRSNGRNLELKPFQIIELQEYVTKVRIQIIEEITKPKPARKPGEINYDKIENQLFISINGSDNLKNSLLHMFKAIQKINPQISNAKQIRTCVIMQWLKQYNLRQVQYMAGHKWVSSTERYQLDNLESLQKALNQYHPLK